MKRIILSALVSLSLVGMAAAETPVFVPPGSEAHSNAHVGIVDSDSNSSVGDITNNNDSSSIASSGSSSSNTNNLGLSSSSGVSNNIGGTTVVTNNDVAASSAASMGSQMTAALCSGSASFSVSAQTIGAGAGLSFRGADRFCQIAMVGGQEAAIAYLASVDRHAYKALKAAGLISDGKSPSVPSKGAPAYSSCKMKDGALTYRRAPGASKEQAIAECAAHLGVRVN